MKKRARRIAMGAAVAGAGVVAALVVAHWDMVRDHVEGRYPFEWNTRPSFAPASLGAR